MIKILDFILRMKIYNKFHSFLGKKIFKFSKIFFVETNYNKLPLINHPLDLNYGVELKKYKRTLSSDDAPFISYSHLHDLLKMTDTYKKKRINFLDFGAGSLELFAYLSKKFKKIKYFYNDQEKYNYLVNNIRKNEKLKRLKILNDFKNNKEKFDYVYFGGSLQYILDYKNSLDKIFKKSKFILISQSPFYFNKDNKKEIVLKQLNLSHNINYLYVINFYEFIKFMKRNKFFLVSKNYNRVIKFLNFKNLRKKYKNIDMYDLLFEKK
jgi:hypothetical protein